MTPIRFVLCAGLALAVVSPAAAQGQTPARTVILTCDIPAAPTAAVVTSEPTRRTFRIGPGVLEEWNATNQAFGKNLCLDYACVKTPDRSEGTLSSASVAFTVGVDHATGAGYWKALGASGFATTQGACQVAAAPPQRRD